MKRKNELSLSEPICRAYNYFGFETSTLSSNPSIRNWYLNDVVNLRCCTRFLRGEYSSPEINMVNGRNLHCPYYERVVYPMRFARGYINYIIKALIDEGYYVCYANVDDYYLEGKSWYKERHRGHDGMIFGYDDNEKTYSILAYDSEWRFRPMVIKQSSFDKGREAIFKKGQYGKVVGIKPKETEVLLDAEKIENNLKIYLTTGTSVEEKSGRDFVQGIGSQELLIAYIQMLSDGKIKHEMTDNRVLRLLWEHKVIMLERLQKMEELLGLDNSVSQEYQSVVSEANKIRILYASYCKKKRESLLLVIINGLEKIIKDEKKLLTEFLKKIKNKKTKKNKNFLKKFLETLTKTVRVRE